MKPTPDIYAIPRLIRGYTYSLLAQALADKQLTQLPYGHGSPILIATGLFGPKESTNQMLRFLRKHDHNARRLDVGLHLPSKKHEAPYSNAFALGVKELHLNTEKKVHLIGWSLGGLIAKLYATRHPEHVAGIYTIASPWQNALESSYLTQLQPLFKLSGRNPLSKEINEELAQTILVPHHSYVALQDEVVDPQLCTSEHTRYYNAGHLEIGFRPDVYTQIITDIAQNNSQQTTIHPLNQLKTTLDTLDTLLT